MLRGNYNIQAYFSTFQVSNPIVPSAPQLLVLDALMALAVTSSAPYSYDQRLAASLCIKAFIYQNEDGRTGLVERIIDTFQEGRTTETPEPHDVLAFVVRGSDTDSYRTWFACTILLHLVSQSKQTKSRLRDIILGDATSGEDLLSVLQQINANLLTSLLHSYDARISIGYLMFLTLCLYSDPASVSDFLSESAGFQTLLSHLDLPGPTGVYLSGLISFLIGVCLLFNPPESPLPRYPRLQVLLMIGASYGH
jgi:intracellular protein transport protein USO1